MENRIIELELDNAKDWEKERWCRCSREYHKSSQVKSRQNIKDKPRQERQNKTQKTRQAKTRQDKIRHDNIKHDNTRQYKRRHGENVSEYSWRMFSYL